MLSRFSQLPRLSFFNNQQYSTKHIDEVVATVKQLGKSGNNNVNNEEILPNIETILASMKKYSNVIQIQRVCCHALSNLAMQVVVARWIMEKGGFKLIKNALKTFEDDHKLCWLGSSAIWNLARPPANRQLIGRTGVNLMLKILNKHNTQEKVTNTTIGALSNLSLCDELKDIIALDKNIDVIIKVLSGYCNKNITTVLTSGAGLLANLAVSDLHANTLVNRNALPILLNVLEWSNNKVINDDSTNQELIQQHETLFRNTCAALNNMVTADNFINSFLESMGVEIVYKFLNNNNSDLYNDLLENCLVHMECDINNKTTSIHLCCLHNKIKILKKLVIKFDLNILNDRDDKNMTCLDYAISMNHFGIILVLTKLGCDISKLRLKAENDEDKLIIQTIKKGRRILKTTINANRIAVNETLKYDLPKDICNEIAGYHGVIDMLTAVNQF